MDAIHHIERCDLPMLERDPDMALVEKILDKEVPYHLHFYELDPEDNVELNLRMGDDMVDFNYLWRLGRKEKPDKKGRLQYMDGTIKDRSDFPRFGIQTLENWRRNSN